jgi:hypothetical protein
MHRRTQYQCAGLAHAWLLRECKMMRVVHLRELLGGNCPRGQWAVPLQETDIFRFPSCSFIMLTRPSVDGRANPRLHAIPPHSSSLPSKDFDVSAGPKINAKTSPQHALPPFGVCDGMSCRSSCAGSNEELFLRSIGSPNGETDIPSLIHVQDADQTTEMWINYPTGATDASSSLSAEFDVTSGPKINPTQASTRCSFAFGWKGSVVLLAMSLDCRSCSAKAMERCRGRVAETRHFPFLPTLHACLR